MKLRLFVALALPAPAVEALTRFRDAAADPAVWRPLAPGTFHVTLAFLGWRADAAPAARVVEQLTFDAPPLALGAALLLPPGRARVLTVAVDDPSGGLAALQAEVAGALAAAGTFEPEARPFRPHVTVARLRKAARPQRSVTAAPDPVAFAGGAVVLFRSHPEPGGARYEPLVSRPPG
ncbi:MAG: RNA 2',3'-cyclic phosphodiesterase [Solirubrobacteraceae bacterium]